MMIISLITMIAITANVITDAIYLLINFKHSGHPTSVIPAIAAWLLLNAGVPHRLPVPNL